MAMDSPTSKGQTGDQTTAQNLHADAYGPINDKTLQNRLADPKDQLINVPVKLPDGKVEQRAYEVHLPNGKDPADAHLPVVFCFDGTTRNKPYTGMAVDNKINAEADKDGFIAIYPLPKDHSTMAGTVRDWNAPGVGALHTDNTYNDVDYIKDVIKDVEQRYHPQTGPHGEPEIHAADMSLGGEFQVKLDHDLPPGTFKDNYVVSSSDFGTEGNPPAGIPAKFVRGDSDPILTDGEGGAHMNLPGLAKPLGPILQLIGTDKWRTDKSDPRRLVAQFVQANGGITRLPEITNHGTYTETRYAPSDGEPIIVDTVKNAGHFWFGRERGGSHETLATDSNGTNPPASAFDCTSDMAKFFGLRKD